MIMCVVGLDVGVGCHSCVNICFTSPLKQQLTKKMQHAIMKIVRMYIDLTRYSSLVDSLGGFPRGD